MKSVTYIREDEQYRPIESVRRAIQLALPRANFRRGRLGASWSLSVSQGTIRLLLVCCLSGPTTKWGGQECSYYRVPGGCPLDSSTIYTHCYVVARFLYLFWFFIWNSCATPKVPVLFYTAIQWIVCSQV